MKQLPHISGLLYGTPWAIIPETHTELGMLYRNYVTGNLPLAAIPAGLAEKGEACHGINYQADHASGIALVSMSAGAVSGSP